MRKRLKKKIIRKYDGINYSKKTMSRLLSPIAFHDLATGGMVYPAVWMRGWMLMRRFNPTGSHRRPPELFKELKRKGHLKA